MLVLKSLRLYKFHIFARIGKQSFSVRLLFNSYSIKLKYQKDRLIIEEYPQVDIKVKIRLQDHPIKRPKIIRRDNQVILTIPKVTKPKPTKPEKPAKPEKPGKSEQSQKGK